MLCRYSADDLHRAAHLKAGGWDERKQRVAAGGRKPRVVRRRCCFVRGRDHQRRIIQRHLQHPSPLVPHLVPPRHRRRRRRRRRHGRVASYASRRHHALGRSGNRRNAGFQVPRKSCDQPRHAYTEVRVRLGRWPAAARCALHSGIVPRCGWERQRHSIRRPGTQPCENEGAAHTRRGGGGERCGERGDVHGGTAAAQIQGEAPYASEVTASTVRVQRLQWPERV